MTKSDESSIVSSVNWINGNKISRIQLEKKLEKIKGEISRLAENTVEIKIKLKKYMGNDTTINIKIGDKYYTLTQSAIDVEINELFIAIEG